MTPGDLVYNSIYKGSLRAGATEKSAKDQAVLGLEDYKKGRFKKPVDLIEGRIKQAKMQSKEKAKKQ